ncbi:hypothetical protein [Paenarthrobacter nicotinovorans]|uniref:hypothetical protein n=1 Tax=Paenarthrobacter nicotinovorans TaxID=29320 RepID=UPI003D67EBF5
MNELTIYSQTLEANEEERTISGLLLPWNEIGHTSAGSVTASKGTLTIPDPSEIFLNLQHQKDSRVGRAVSLEEREDGLHATFRIAKTNAGNDLIEEVKEGLRAHLSIEISNPVIKAGKVLAGLVSGAASVCTPAFKSAAVYSLTAADNTPSPEKETTMESTSENLEAAETVSVVQAEPIFAASANPADLGALTFAAYNSGNTASINAALADLKTTNDGGKFYIQDQEVGELWTARQTERKLVNAVGVKPLTSLTQTGTKKNRTFAVSNWAGNKVELPTATFSTSREVWTATSKAVAIDIAMELIEFGGEGVISEAYEEAMDSYIVQTEAELLTYLVAQATAVTGVTSAIAAIDKASETLGNIGANMSFIAVAPNVMAALRNVTSSAAPWWLASQGAVNLRDRSIDLGGVTLTSNPALANGTILVGDSRAVDYRESKDFKFRALDLPRGGVDVSFIKFKSQYVTDRGALLKITGVTGA